MEASPLDFVAQSCMDLTEAINDVSSEVDKDSLIINHIKKVWSIVIPVEDFKKDLDWVNVSEPISLSQHCNDKIVVLDFWTYCCINCYHVLPDLAHLEKLYTVENGLVVIGVHCAKFNNEKDSGNILSAVQRYNIHHPVVNDADSSVWEAFGIHCWPTLLILGPGNKPIFVLTGEGHRDELVWYVRAAIGHFGSRISDASLPVSPSNLITPSENEVLCFPSKVALNPFYRGRAEEPFLAISDTGHHRILLTDCSGIILRIIGGTDPGLKDGSFYCQIPSRWVPPQRLFLPPNSNVQTLLRSSLKGAVAGEITGVMTPTSYVSTQRAQYGAVCASFLVPHFYEWAYHLPSELNEAKFDSPQGVSWLSSNVLAVCDTNNHAVRAVHLDDGTVEVLVGTGEQSATGDLGGKTLGLQPLSSPWDVVLYSTPDMDMSVRPQLPLPPPPSGTTNPEPNDSIKEKEKKDEKRRVLLIACAGSHQIWALFLDNTIWWKYKSYSEGVCVCIAGSGVEAARNSAYPNTAAFAQPSGLSLRTGTSPEIFIADSESSSIRRLALSTGQVSTLCGGDRNPLNLFAYGDVDDIGVEAKFQHPLGIAFCEANKTLYVADTYNHKIRKVDIGPQKVTTLNPTMIETTDPAKFNEPSGLSVSSDGKYLYIADTNNHSIKILNVTKNVCQEFKVRLPDPKFSEPEDLIIYKNDLFVNRKCGNIVILFNVNLDTETRNVKFTPGAPQNWCVCIRDPHDKDVTFDDFEFVGCTNKGTNLPGRLEIKLKQRTDKTHYRLYHSFHTALCDGSVCFSHTFTIKSSILVRDSVKMLASYKITCKVNPLNFSNKAGQKKM